MMNAQNNKSLLNKNKNNSKKENKSTSYNIMRIKLKRNKRLKNNNFSNELDVSTNCNDDNQMKINYKRLLENYEKKFFYQMRNLPIIKNHKSNSVYIINEEKENKIIGNGIHGNRKNNNYKLFYLSKFNYSFSIDKNNIFCLKYKKPKENIRKRTINIINQITYNKMKDEYKQPKMIKILERNDKIHDEIFSQPWRYPNLFKD